jgi:hypothetical protein
MAEIFQLYDTNEINQAFVKYARENGISLEHEDDWVDWFRCWVDGYTNGVNDVKEIMSGSKENNMPSNGA